MNGCVYLHPVENAPNGGSLLTKGSFDDLQKMGLTPEEGMRLRFYDFDADAEDRPTYLSCEGVLHYDKEHGVWCAIVDRSSVHSVLRENAGE